LFSKYSDREIEFELLQQLKSDAYDDFRTQFVSSEKNPGLQYPEIVIKECPVLQRDSLLTCNPCIKFKPLAVSDTGQPKPVIEVCKNYVPSKQSLREEFRRENTFVELVAKRDVEMQQRKKTLN
jgi:hypothetical protein